MKSQSYDDVKSHILTPNLKLVSEKLESFRSLVANVKTGFEKNEQLVSNTNLSTGVHQCIQYADECAFNLEASIAMALLQIQANVDYEVLHETWSVIKEGVVIIEEMSIQFNGIKEQLAA